VSGADDPIHIPDCGSRESPDVSREVTYESLRLGDVIGVGSNATVYAATGPGGTPLALKEAHVRASVPPDLRQRFERESEIWRRADDHPNVVTLHTAGTDPRPWLALERVGGGNLHDHDPLPIEALWIGVRVADALGAAHDTGVAHLDITPENVLLRETAGDDWPIPALSDFGVATLLGDRVVNLEALSPRYAAPEQFDPDRFGRPDGRTDVYQLGAVLYELLTGQPPFTGPPAALQRAVVAESPAPVTGLDPTLPAELDAVLDRALAKDPAGRYRSADAFAAALAEVFTAETGHELEAPHAGERSGIGHEGPIATGDSADESATRPYDRAITLDEQGFVQVTDGFFARREPAPLVEAWRRGLDLVDVHAGRAVARDPPTTTGQEAGAFAGLDAENMTEALVATLRHGSDCAVLGPPGSGKSTVCKQVACAWTERDYGPVFYRESGGTAFEDPDAIVQVLARTGGHALVVVEDAVRPDADAVFELLRRVEDSEDVSVIVDAREQEWNAAGRNTAVQGVDPIAEGKQHLAAAFVPRPDRATHERFIEQATTAVADAPAIDADQLVDEVRRSHVTADADDAAPGELFYLIHRLTTLIRDPLADETTALTDTVRKVREKLATAGEHALDVGMAVNLLNAAGLGVHSELVYAVAPEDPVTVVDAIDALDGDVVSPRATDWESSMDPYPAVHEAWSAEYLAVCLDVAGEAAARERFGRVVTRLLAVADDPDLRERITDQLHGRAAYLDRVAADPANWVDDALERLLDVGEQQPRLAPLLGTTETVQYELPSVCPESTRRELLRRRGTVQRKYGAYEAARAEYEQCLDRSRVVGDRQDELDCLDRLGDVAYRQGEYDAAREHYEQSLAIACELGDRRKEARGLHKLGIVAFRQGKYDATEEYCERSLSIARDLGDRRIEAQGLNNLGMIAFPQGEYDTARKYYEQSLAIARDLGDRGDEAQLLNNLGEVRKKQDEYDAAREYYERSLARKRDLGDRRGAAVSLNNLGEVAEKRNRYRTAREHYEAATDIFGEISATRDELEVIERRARLAVETSDREAAIEWCERGLALIEDSDLDDLDDRQASFEELHPEES